MTDKKQGYSPLLLCHWPVWILLNLKLGMQREILQYLAFKIQTNK